MLVKPLRRLAAIVLAIALLFAWSAPVFAVAATGAHCTAAMAGGPVSAPDQPVDSGDCGLCKAGAVCCVNGSGCVSLPGLPVVSFDFSRADVLGTKSPARASALLGRTIKPELAPPNLRQLI
jgi:hypothetical protein